MNFLLNYNAMFHFWSCRRNPCWWMPERTPLRERLR